MSNISTQQLIDKVNLWITANGVKAITGPQLNEILKDMCDSLVHFDDDYAYLNLQEYSAVRNYKNGETCLLNGVLYQNASGGDLINVSPLQEDPDPWVAITVIDSDLWEFAPYDNAATYESPNTVRLGNKLFLCISGSPIQGITPPDPTYWQEVSPAMNRFGVLWAANTYYGKNRVVRHLDGLWQMNVAPGYLSTDFLAELGAAVWAPLPNVYPITEAELTAAIAGNQIAVNRIYYITDKRIFVTGLNQFSVSSSGHYWAQNADYNNASGVMLYSLGTAVWDDKTGAWWTAVESDYPDPMDRQGKMCIYQNRHYRNVSGDNDFSPPDGDPANWEPVDLDDDSYQEEIDSVVVDAASSFSIVERRDKRGNVVTGASLVVWQWGNNFVTNNIVHGSADILDNMGVINGNHLFAGTLLFATLHGRNNPGISTIERNVISSGRLTVNENTAIIRGNHIDGEVTLDTISAEIRSCQFYKKCEASGVTAIIDSCCFIDVINVTAAFALSNSTFIGSFGANSLMDPFGPNTNIYEIKDYSLTLTKSISGGGINIEGGRVIQIDNVGIVALTNIGGLDGVYGKIVTFIPSGATTINITYGTNIINIADGAASDSYDGSAGHYFSGYLTSVDGIGSKFFIIHKIAV